MITHAGLKRQPVAESFLNKNCLYRAGVSQVVKGCSLNALSCSMLCLQTGYGATPYMSIMTNYQKWMNNLLRVVSLCLRKPPASGAGGSVLPLLLEILLLIINCCPAV